MGLQVRNFTMGYGLAGLTCRECFLVEFRHEGTKNSRGNLPSLKFNIAPEKLPSEKESSLPTIIFQGFSC